MTDTAATATHRHELTAVLTRFRAGLPGALRAVLATTDGLVVAAAEDAAREDAERLAAIGAGLHSLARGLDDGHLRQAFIETPTSRVFVVGAAEGTVLSVVARLEADPVLVGHEMGLMVARVESHLATPARERER
ncbi:roadblock/LC7 domain-containing protein [Actinacidiphila sp. bgisy144]|uniref:roadblock/LC7 domain-containing protein n=1 Tax=Actinacidiphila sp. bgisy144 TaxID=3413791 RepID=UPI003EB6EE53